MSKLKGERNVTPIKSKIVLRIRYNMTKSLNLVIVFWTVIKFKRLKSLIVLGLK